MTARVIGNSYTFDEIINYMKKDGWRSDPIDVVKNSDGSKTTVDNTRVRAAREAGIDVNANVHASSDPLPPEMMGRFGNSSTWGEAIDYRIQNQSGSFSTDYPTGSPNDPKLTGVPK